MSFDQVIADAEVANQAAVMLSSVDLSGTQPIPMMAVTTIEGGLTGVNAGNGLRESFASLQSVMIDKAHSVDQIAHEFMVLDSRLAQVLRG